LYRTQRVIDEDQVRIVHGLERFQFIGLAGADEEARIGFFDACAERADDGRAGRARKLAEFLERGGGIALADPGRLDEYRALAFLRSFEQEISLPYGPRARLRCARPAARCCGRDGRSR
jgi:hypothetical protein